MTDDMRPGRRNFLAAGGGLAAATLAAPVLSQQPGSPFLITSATDVLLPKGKAQRVVICGGGWGGLNAAKQLRLLAPQLEVVLLERNPVFFGIMHQLHNPQKNKKLQAS